jgi:hypothetical protein
MPLSHLVKTTPRPRGALLAALIGIALLAPALSYATSFPWLPRWLGAALSITALFGVLYEFWRISTLRGILLIAFIMALSLAATSGLSQWR